MEYEEEQVHYSPDVRSPIPGTVNQPAYAPQENKRKGISIWRILGRIIFVLSLLANLFLFFALIILAAFVTAGQGAIFETRDAFLEKVIQKGSSNKKIVVIRLEGIINNTLSEEVRKQIKVASEDKNIKALIIRTITPGGGVAASDQINYEIKKFREETGKPVVAFMQNVAASGGYYTSVACDKIIAEPTVITGSIGVMLNHLVLKQLLEEKLGISPVVIKSGRRKDWPSMFSETTEEQKQYLNEKLVIPAFDRFVELVDQGREALDEEQVRQLADGSIYGAPEAVEKQLIDDIGYIDEAIAMTEELAGIKNAHVVEYTRPFTFSSLLLGKKNNLLNIDKQSLQELAMPQLLYLWDASW